MAKSGWSGMKPTEFVAQIESDLVDRQKEIATLMLQGVVTKSPVDTGTYKGNHRVSISTPDYSSDKSTTDPGGSKTISAGIEVINTLHAPYTVIFVQNNIIYGERLENGWSGQAADGVYGVTFNAVMQQVRERYG